MGHLWIRPVLLRTSFVEVTVALSLLFHAPSQGSLVINEIHVAPDVKTELVEFVELYNPGTSEMDLGGWVFSEGIDFVFPTGARIPSGGYVVVAENPAALQQKFGGVTSYGPWSGKLSNEGERIVLRNSGGEVDDEVEYQVGFPWPTVGDAPGDSMELIHPALDNNLGGSWRRSRVGDAPVQSRTLIANGASWRYLKGMGEASALGSAWRQLGFNDSNWAVGETPIGYGEGFVTTVLNDMQAGYTSVLLRSKFVLDDPAALTTLLLEAQYDDGIKIWINGVNLVNANISTIEVPLDGTANSAIENASFVPFPLSSPGTFLVRGTNVIAVQAHNSSLSASSDFFFDLGLTAQIGTASRGPTPGRRNAVYAENLPPQVRHVTHEPEQPSSGNSVRITAKVSDSDGLSGVSLEYQVVEPGSYIEMADAAYRTNWVSLPMTDSGAGADQVAGDETYSTAIPAGVQSHRRLVRYRVTARDSQGRTITTPYADDPQPNFAYFVYDGVPAWTGAIQPASADPGRRNPVTYGTNIMRRLPVYHLISKKSSVDRATWLDRYGGDLYKWKGTLVYDGKVYDHIAYRARGGVWRYAMGKNMWKFDFNRGHAFEARDNFRRKYDVPWTKLNLGACIQQGDYQHRGEQGMFESVGFRLFNLAGVEAPQTHFVQFRVIDEARESDPGNQYAGDFWGLYLAIEQEDGRFLEEHGLPDGNFYKMEGGTGELNNQGPLAATDKSDLNGFLASYRNVSASDSWWRSNFSLDRYYNYQAMVQGIHHYDICYGKNYFYYLNPETSLWSVHPWDLDLTWADNMYDAGCGGTDEFKNRVLNRPAFKLEYQNCIRELRDLLFNTDQAWKLIDEFASIIDDPAGGPAFVDADRAMWDYNPIMANGSVVNLSKAGQGRFYQAVATKDFPGMVKKMKDYVVSRGAYLDRLSDDPLIPDLPVISFSGPAGFPANRLAFRASPYAGANPFGQMKWRVGEVKGTRPAESKNQQNQAAPFEIEPVWESAVLPSFAPDILLPADLLQVGRTYRVRVRMGDNTGRWSHWSEPVEFTAAAPDSTGALLNHLRVSEVMYNPPAGSDHEFIELANTSPTLSLDLSGVAFTQGIEYTFSAGSILSPGGYVLVVRAPSAGDFAVFRSHYAISADVPIVGPFGGALNNDGEQIVLKSGTGGPNLLEFQFGDGSLWPLAADGAGHSLVPRERAMSAAANGSLNYAGHWRASTSIKGSPGRADPEPLPGAVLNEIVAHPDSNEPGSNDWIELYNPTDTALTFGAAWFLSDDAATLRKWQLPSSLTLPAGGWLSFDEITGFRNPPGTGFGLSKNGEQVFLSHLPGTSADRVVDSIRFKAQENGWSFGRFPDGSGFWSALSPQTRNLANSEPPLRVVMSEIMFHPKPTSLNPDDNSVDEYIELHNPTSAPVSLFNSNGAWRLEGGIKLSFPAGTVIAPGGTLLLVNFSPTNAAAVAAFKNSYGFSGPVESLIGPYEGKLNNSSDRIALEKPQNAELADSLPVWVLADEVVYSDQEPWPSSADGSGLALERLSFTRPGNDPGHWRAAEPTPGRVAAGPADGDRDGIPDDWERDHGLDPAFAGDAALDADGDGLSNLNEYRAGTNPRDRSSSLRLSARVEDDRAVLSFTAVARKSYHVTYLDSLSQSVWRPLGHVLAGPDTRVVIIHDPITNLGGQRYYRVEWVPDP